jgi:magnesium transporter
MDIAPPARGSLAVARQGAPLSDVPLADLDDTLAQGAGVAWLDLDHTERLLFDQAASHLRLHELALEDALSANQSPKIEDYGDTLFLVARSARIEEKRLRLGELHLFIGAGFVVSVQHDSQLALARVRERLPRPPREVEVSPGWLVYLLLDQIVDDYRPVLDAFQTRFEELEGHVLAARFERRNLFRLYELKREVAQLAAIMPPLEEALGAIMRLHADRFGKPLRAYLRDVHDHLTRLIAACDRFDDQIADALQLSLASATLRQNQAVQKLAGWGAVLAIPTVVFSLFGMNFKHMPELDWVWSYPIVVVGTGIAMVLLYRRLKRSGWL